MTPEETYEPVFERDRERDYPKYSSRVNQAVAWVAGHLDQCDYSKQWATLLQEDPACICGHGTMRVLVVPGPVGGALALVHDGQLRLPQIGEPSSRFAYSPTTAKHRSVSQSVDDFPMRLAWDSLSLAKSVSREVDEQMRGFSVPSFAEEEDDAPADGLYVLGNKGLQLVTDATRRWLGYSLAGHSPSDCAKLLLVTGGEHLLFVNRLGGMAVVEWQLLS